MEPVDQQAIRDLLAQIEVMSHRMDEEDASGWVVLVRDDEHGTISLAVGTWPTGEDALIEAGRMRQRDLEQHEGEDPDKLWTYTVVPLFSP